MAKFRKKPVVIEAVQYFNWMREQDRLPDGVFICPWPWAALSDSQPQERK